ncbi:alpha/beta hydrolase [Parasphingorhabdus sp.]|uniref:alpha/beta hydrolase n=1 Tax=Parasphingorhabdus sp. TaxID=2709688 RepID=UPI003A9576D3
MDLEPWCSREPRPYQNTDVDNPGYAKLRAALEARLAKPETTLAELRAFFEDGVERMPSPEDIAIEDVDDAGVRGTWYRPRYKKTNRVILHFHGGGFAMGSSRSVRPLSANIVRASSVASFALDYRLAPEHPCPAQIHDAAEAYAWLLSQNYRPEDVVFAGDSAGGGLVVSALVEVRERGLPMPAGAVCISPWTDMTLTAQSLVENDRYDPQFANWFIASMAERYLGDMPASDPQASPVFADLTGLPPLLIQVGAVEALLDDSLKLAEAAEGAGVDVTLECWDQMIHVWHQYAPRLTGAVVALDRIAEWLDQLWERQVEPA